MRVMLSPLTCVSCLTQNVDLQANNGQPQELAAWQVHKTANNGFSPGVDLELELRGDSDARQADSHSGLQVASNASSGHDELASYGGHVDQ